MTEKNRKGVKEANVSNLRFQTFAWKVLREITKNIQPGQGANRTLILFLSQLYELFKLESHRRFLIPISLIWSFSVRVGLGGPNRKICVRKNI
jgi:hypothetical protein